LIKKIKIIFSYIFFPIFGHQNPGPGSGSGSVFSVKDEYGSGINKSISKTLMEMPFMKFITFSLNS